MREVWATEPDHSYVNNSSHQYLQHRDPSVPIEERLLMEG